MGSSELRFRQIHLDFHTSEAIEGIGADFDAETFAATLAEAAVDSITCFARGHHGWLYYDSKAFPERIHPHLENKNLLAEQIEACHRHDIRVPIYITVQWDHYTAQRHPEWLVITPEGKLDGPAPYEAGFYRTLCLNSPYRDFLKTQTQEVLETLPTDGLFFDIVQPKDCSCQYCLAGMQQTGLDASKTENRMRYAVDMLHEFKRDMTALVRKFNKKATIFYNAGHVGPRLRSVADAYSHFELESLPTGGWGYAHFPLTVRYARNLGRDCLAMTGKFHTTWGDFHSFKYPAALEFECFSALAFGAKCSIGDQLPPRGKICQETYALIGPVYQQVAQKEAFCRGAEPVTEIAVFTPEEHMVIDQGGLPKAALGAMRILQEGGHQFDMIDSQSNLTQYRLLVLPDMIRVSKTLAVKLKKFIAKGGKLIASHESGLSEDGGSFTMDAWPVNYQGEAPHNPDFLRPKGPIGKGLPQTEHVMYMRAAKVKAVKGSKTLAGIVNPYFNRTWEHFCSHLHAPTSGKKGSAGIVRKNDIIYFAHPIFQQYQKNAPRWCKRLLLNAVDMLLGEPLVRTDGPSSLITTLNLQRKEKRLVLHLLHYISERRSDDIDIIEDVIPLHQINVAVNCGRRIRNVQMAESGESLHFEQKDGMVRFTVAKLQGHTMACLDF